MPKSSCVVKVSVLDVPSVVEVLNRIRNVLVLLGDIEQDTSVPPAHRQRIRIWREDNERAMAKGLRQPEPVAEPDPQRHWLDRLRSSEG